MTYAPELPPSAFSITHHRLAAGVEPLDAMSGGRAAALLDVAFDRPALLPLFQLPPEKRPTGMDSYTRPFDTLTRLGRHESGRYSAVDVTLRPSPLLLRLGDDSRRCVPRRLAVTYATVPVIVRPAMFPGATFPLPPRATGVRGLITHGAGGPPARWARVEVADLTGVPLGFAHGDDRGEFVLLIETPAVQTTLNPTLTVNLKVHTRPAPLTPGNPDEQAAFETDSLWDLPAEALASPNDPLVAGRGLLPGTLTQLTPVNGVVLDVSKMKSLTVVV